MKKTLDAANWNNRYLNQETGWDIGYPSTPLKTYIDQLKDKAISILIPGCGNGYEAAYLLERGFERVTVIDIAPVLTTNLEIKLKPLYGNKVTIITGDFFALEGNFDLILEQTFFCALKPALRESYARKMSELLTGSGKLAGVLFNTDFENGPPFGGNTEVYWNLFSPYFQIKKMEPCYNSIDSRKTTELFIILEAAPHQ